MSKWKFQLVSCFFIFPSFFSYANVITTEAKWVVELLPCFIYFFRCWLAYYNMANVLSGDKWGHDDENWYCTERASEPWEKKFFHKSFWWKRIFSFYFFQAIFFSTCGERKTSKKFKKRKNFIIKVFRIFFSSLLTHSLSENKERKSSSCD